MLKFIAATLVVLACNVMSAQEVSRLPGLVDERGGVLVAKNENTFAGAQEATATRTAKVGALPDAPSAQVSAGPTGDSYSATSSNLLPNASKAKSEHAAGSTFWIVTSIAFASSAANVEVISRCAPTSCQSIPPAIRSRGALYGIAIPATAGVSYLGYRMKRDGNKWWFLPATILIQGNFIYAAHSASWTR